MIRIMKKYKRTEVKMTAYCYDSFKRMRTDAKREAATGIIVIMMFLITIDQLN